MSILKQEDSTTSTHSLGLFRFAFGLYILFIVFRLYPFRDIYFDQLADIQTYRFPAKMLFALWGLSAAMLAIGLLTRVFSIINYVLTLLATCFFSIIHIGSFNDDILRIMGLMMILLPVSSSFSVDALLASMAGKPKPTRTPTINYHLILIISLGVIYTGSAVTKLFSPLWQEGLGLWKPYVVPSKRWLDITWLMNNEAVMKGLNYAVLAWELVFVFLFFRKGLKLFFAVTGILLHLFIALLFPFPLYCVGPVICYILFIPESFWNRWRNWWQSSTTITVEFNESGLLKKQLLEAIDYRHQFRFITGEKDLFVPQLNLHGQQAFGYLLKQYPLLHFVWQTFYFIRLKPIATSYYRMMVTDLISDNGTTNISPQGGRQRLFVSFCVMLMSIQLVIQVYGVYSLVKVSASKRLSFLTIDSRKYDLSAHPVNLARNLFGINRRGLFLDASSTGKLKVVRIAEVVNGQEHFLPMYDEKGYCQWLIRDFNWTLFAHHYFLTPTGLNIESFKKFTAFWMKREGINPDQANFRVYSRTYEMPAQFEPDYLRKMEVIPWNPEGEISWKDSSFNYTPFSKDTVQ